MSEQTTIRVTIKNRLGLHARPAMSLVDTASRFDAQVNVRRVDDASGELVDAKSIMQVMMLAATQGTELEITASGGDAEKACSEIKSLVDRGFDEE
ncbi:MAG: HPr family phosphocarrier protein [Planctomycetota bacterium]